MKKIIIILAVILTSGVTAWAVSNNKSNAATVKVDTANANLSSIPNTAPSASLATAD